jgi:hypothetical protein
VEALRDAQKHYGAPAPRGGAPRRAEAFRGGAQGT